MSNLNEIQYKSMLIAPETHIILLIMFLSKQIRNPSNNSIGLCV